jgi:hypothetical protein
MLGPSGLAPSQFGGGALALVLAGLAKLRTPPGADWMRGAVARAAEEFGSMPPQVRRARALEQAVSDEISRVAGRARRASVPLDARSCRTRGAAAARSRLAAR